MKKLFTLIAMACMALGANAQDVIVFDNTKTYVDEQSIKEGDVTLVLGKDIKKATAWDNKASSHGTGVNILPFSQKLMVENSDTKELEEKDRIVYISGGNNPKDDDSNTGNGYNPDTKNLPKSGTYYKVTTTKNGTILAGIILNKDKSFYICKESDGSAFDVSSYNMKDGDGADVTVSAEGKIDTKITGTVEFDVEANETYYFFCTGSKLGCFGVQFTPAAAPSDPTAIQNVNAAVEGNGKAYNLGGRVATKGLLIQNGKKVIK